MHDELCLRSSWPPGGGRRRAAAAEPRDRAEAYYHFSLGQQARLGGRPTRPSPSTARPRRLDPALRRDPGRDRAAAARGGQGRRGPGRGPGGGARSTPTASTPTSSLAQLYQLRAEARRRRGVPAQRGARVRGGRAPPARRRPHAAEPGRALRPAPAARGRRPHLGAATSSSTPATSTPYVQLGGPLLARGRVREGRGHAAEGPASCSPARARAYQSLGDIYARAEQTDQAIAQLPQGARAGARQHPRPARRWARSSSARRRPQEALAEAEAVLAADAKNRFALDLKGRALRDLQRVRRGATPRRTQAPGRGPDRPEGRLPQGHDRGGAARLRGRGRQLEAILARNRAGEDAEEAGEQRPRLPASTSASPTSSSSARRRRGRLRRAPRRVGGEPDAALLGYDVEALLPAKDLDQALAEVRAGPRALPRRPRPGRARGDDPARGRATWPARWRIVEKLREKSPQDVEVLVQVADFYQRAKQLPGGGDGAAPGARPRAQGPARRCSSSGAVLERAEEARRGGGGLPRGAGRASPTPRPSSTTSGYMNADRGVRARGGARAHREGGDPRPRERRLPRQPGLGALPPGPARAGRGARCARRSPRRRPTRVVLDHLGDILKRRGDVREALEYWQQGARRARTRTASWTAPACERKIREAQAGLDAARRHRSRSRVGRRDAARGSPRRRSRCAGAAAWPPAPRVPRAAARGRRPRAPRPRDLQRPAARVARRGRELRGRDRGAPRLPAARRAAHRDPRPRAARGSSRSRAASP